MTDSLYTPRYLCVGISGIPYQVLMNYYLDDCVRQKKKLQFVESASMQR
ncbi:MAG: hypothetical protein NC429_11920 [Lachnospiraceae bacterium]|nr:hypothetical protein [Lachnospiraceae bacterium]